MVVVSAMVLLLAGVSLAHVLRHTSTLKYDAYVTSTPEPGACFDAVGLDTGLWVQLPKRPKTAAEYKKLADANTPRAASVEIGKKTYRLDLDPKTSAYGSDQIGWNFKHVRISKTDALSLIGKRAVIRYKIGRKTLATQPTVIADGRCKSLI
jgi:hypothetical protein